MILFKKKMRPKVYSFPLGGISFEDSSVPSRLSCETAFLPSLSVIPMLQHSGRAANPVVSVGEAVREGMLIGRSRGPGSANVHATVPGRVIRIVPYKSAGGQVQDGVVIRLEGSFEKLGKREDMYSWDGMLPHDIQKTIAEFGVVEMEGAGKPVSEIISHFRSTPDPITLVVSCVFDDPWLAADYVLCRERTAAVAEGALIAARACRISRIIYAISHGEKELGDSFLAAGAKWKVPTEIVLVGSRYPQRNQRELELVLRNYGKKEGIDLGSLFVLGPSTLAAVYDAVKKRKPVLDRYVAVGGSAIRHPRIMKVRIGKRIGELIEECGGFTGPPKKIAVGSPLQGRVISDLDEPVIKTSYAIFARLEEQRRDKQSNCISCGECRTVCPVGLDPEELYKRNLVIEKDGQVQELPADRAAECHGCGCCELVCPSSLNISEAIAASAMREN